MRTPLILSISLLTLFFSCDFATKEKQEKKVVSHLDTLHLDSPKAINQLEETLQTTPKEIKPVLGYRFIISGDFDGDGTKEKLTEHFLSGLDNKETNKFYENLPDYEQLVALTEKKEPISFITSDNKRIDTLHISSDKQLLGLFYLKNEGDLNGDGSDEVSYVVNWADWSSLNICHLITYKNKKWTELYSFPIWDWQLPDLPETFDQYGPFGLEQKIINTVDDTLNKRLENEFLNFEGLVKKIKTNQVQVIFRNKEADEDTMVVDLAQLKRRK